MLDLSIQQPVSLLIEHIYELELTSILKTQERLNIFFLVNYILNKDYQFSEDDMKINAELVCKFQPHIKYLDLITGLFKIDASLLTPHFDTISNL